MNSSRCSWRRSSVGTILAPLLLLCSCVALMEQPPCQEDEDCLPDQLCDQANRSCRPRSEVEVDAGAEPIDGGPRDVSTPDQGISLDRALQDRSIEAGPDAQLIDAPADRVVSDLLSNDVVTPDVVTPDAVSDSSSPDMLQNDRASGSDLALPDSAPVSQPIAIINGDFEASTEKTWFWDYNGNNGTGALIPGAIPGWSTDDDPGIGGRDGKGDSGVEPEGNPGMRLFINSVDGEIYQTTSYSIQTGDSYQLSWDMLFTYGGASNGTLVVVATLYYLQWSTRVPLDSTTITEQQNSVFLPFTLEVGSVPPQAAGRQLGLAFDNVTDELYSDAQTWVGVDNVALTVTR
jgi:hypothetical protein